MKNSTQKLFLFLALFLGAKLGMAQTTPATYTTVGIVGDATANGWNTSTPMTSVAGSDGHVWTITLPLTVGAVKFRANDNWDVNWGATEFPAGIGTQGGANIPVATAGTYTVTLDDRTGAYAFTTGTSTSSRSASTSVNALALAPNPARNAARISYELPTAAAVAVSVHNTLGQTVRQFAPVRQGAGRQDQAISLSGLASGMYLVQVQINGQRQTTRLVVE